MKPIAFLFLPAALAALWGCSSGEISTNGPDSKTSGSAEISTSSSPTSSEPAASAPTPASIPNQLRHAGFLYYGLDSDSALAYAQTVDGRTEDAGQQTKLDRIENGKAYFKTERTGQFASIGPTELMVDETGVYTVNVNGKVLDKPSLEVPADLAVGKSWKSISKFTINSGGRDIEVAQNMSYKVARAEKVTTKAGVFDTLQIKASGTMTVDDAVSDNSTTIWFSKGVGFVKMDTKMTRAGKTQNLSVVLIKK